MAKKYERPWYGFTEGRKVVESVSQTFCKITKFLQSKYQVASTKFLHLTFLLFLLL